MRSALAVSLFGLLAALSSDPSRAGELDGVTVIDLAGPEAGEAIRGHARGNAYRLVTYVSASGTYAALSDKGTRHCVAPAQPGTYTGRQITFGMPADEATIRLVSPGICQAFTLKILDENKVLIEVNDNRFERIGGPLGPNTVPVSHAGEHRVLARVPLLPLDWSKVSFSGLKLKGVPIGPLPAITEYVGRDGSLEIKPRGREQDGIQPVSLKVQTGVAGETITDELQGLVVRGARLNWPWDVLYQLSSKEYLSQSILTEVFETAATQRFGPVTLRQAKPGDTIHQMHWLLDLDGSVVPADSTSPDNCLATFDLWAGRSIPAIRDDIGPWNCSLVMTVSYNGSTGALTQQAQELTSGYVLGLLHFSKRLEEINAALVEIERTRAHKPKI